MDTNLPPISGADGAGAHARASQPPPLPPSLPSRISLGLAGLDRLLDGGARPGWLVVLAGWPGSGLSCLARRLAEGTAVDRRQTTAFLLPGGNMMEYVHEHLLERAQVDEMTFHVGPTSEDDLKRITSAAAQLSVSPLYLNTDDTCATDGERTRLAAWLRQHRIRLLIVDDWQRLTPTADVPPALMARWLQALARELGIVVLVLSRLAWNPAGRHGREDLLDVHGGSLAQAADVGLLLYRAPAEVTGGAMDGQRFTAAAELIIAAHPEGRPGSLALRFDDAFHRFEEQPADTHPAS